MRRFFVGACLCLFVLLPAAASEEGEARPHSRVLDASCGIDSGYALHVGPDGLRLDADADGAVPGRIGISDGALRLDGVPRAVSEDDAERLRGIEAGVRGLLPDMMVIAREAVGITFDALGGVNAALGGKRSKAREFEHMREGALARLEEMERRGEWSQDLFDDDFEAGIEAAAGAMAASFTPARGIWMVVSGGVGRMERRMEKWEEEFERSVAAREVVMEHHATALCSGLEEVQRLQDAMELRLDDGRPLRVFEIRHGAIAAAGAEAE